MGASVLVCLGYQNKIPQTGWLKLKNFNFLAVLEAEESMIKALTDSVSGESFLLGL